MWMWMWVWVWEEIKAWDVDQVRERGKGNQLLEFGTKLRL